MHGRVFGNDAFIAIIRECSMFKVQMEFGFEFFLKSMLARKSKLKYFFCKLDIKCLICKND